MMADEDCIFCKIVKGQIPCQKVYEDEHFLVFHDIIPKAKVHVLVIPKNHITSLAEINQDHLSLLGELTLLLPKIAEKLGLKGFRTIVNTGKEGGQEVPHLHYHILGGPNLSGF